MKIQKNNNIYYRIVSIVTASIILGLGMVSIAQADLNGVDRRMDRRDTRQDCRHEEGIVGKDKRDCKQDERQDNRDKRQKRDDIEDRRD